MLGELLGELCRELCSEPRGEEMWRHVVTLAHRKKLLSRHDAVIVQIEGSKHLQTQQAALSRTEYC